LALLLITWVVWSDHLGAVDAMAIEQHPAELNREGALRLVEAGRRAMIDSNTTPARTVDAALAFVKAVQFFNTSGDSELVRELKANIFWCKKRMNLDQVREFLAAKGNDPGDAKLITEAADLVAKVVDTSEAKAYFDRANAYAKANPTAYMQITSRYFEVAERFIGTDISEQAHRLSLAAQKQMMEQTKIEQEMLRATIFTRTAAIPAPGRNALATPEDLRDAVATIRKQYKDEYANRRPAQKRQLAAYLAKEAGDNSKPVTMRYALYQEAGALALAAKDYFGLLKIADTMAGDFAVDAKDQKLAWLGKVTGDTMAAALVTLLNNPLDPKANAVVGKGFCFNENQWDEGVRVLALGNDQTLKTVAEMEVLKPEGSAQQVELADHWHELSGKVSGSQKEEMIIRSVYWYNKALLELKGITKERVAQRLLELNELLPYTKFNYAKGLTVKQWERIPVKPVELSASSSRLDTGLVLTRGMRVRIVPHPTESWSFNYSSTMWKHYETKEPMSNIFDTNCWGQDAKIKGLGGRTIRGTSYPDVIGAVVMCIETGKSNYAGLLKGEEQPAFVKYDNHTIEGSLSGLGKVFIGANLPGKGIGSGSIRIKICVLDEE
jgi:hypothetical protein